jgi:hypothetical protein
VDEFSFGCDPQETDKLYLSQNGLRLLDAMADTLERWRSRTTPASLQDFVEDLQRRCIRDPPKDVALTQSPVEQTVDPEQVMYGTSSSSVCLIYIS